MSPVRIAIFIVIAIALLWSGMEYNRQADVKSASERIAAAEAEQKKMQDLLGKLKITDIKEGTGPAVVSGNQVAVQYTGTLTDGTKFDSSYDRGGQPLEFVVGRGELIQGWDLGILGMKVGGKRNLTIPPELAYGDRAVGPIPPNSTLNFELELVSIK